ncbi:unnamed protein product [Heterobilharzia americana]|nr:unnamed protein product [Heterobilharzia americana]
MLICNKLCGARRGAYAGWISENTPERLDFVDDHIHLMSLKLEELQAKTNKVTEEERQQRKTTLPSGNVEKTEVTKISNQQQHQEQQAPITMNGINVKEVVSHLPTYISI